MMCSSDFCPRQHCCPSAFFFIMGINGAMRDCLAGPGTGVIACFMEMLSVNFIAIS